MSSAPEARKKPKPDEDAIRAMKFLAGKAAIFILIPLAAALIAVWWRFG